MQNNFHKNLSDRIENNDIKLHGALKYLMESGQISDSTEFHSFEYSTEN